MGRRLEDYQLRALDLLVHDLRRRDGRALVVLPDDDHRRHPDGADAVSKVEPRDGLAAADVAGRRCGPDHPAYGLDDEATLFLERRGEPPAQRSLHERVHPLRLGRVDALVPQWLRFGWDAARRVAEYEAREELRRLKREGLADHAAH